MEPATMRPDETVADEIEAGDQDFDIAERPEIPAPTIDLITGLLAGFRLAGRPR